MISLEWMLVKYDFKNISKIAISLVPVNVEMMTKRVWPILCAFIPPGMVCVSP